jgi:hypothetical protein
MAERLTRESLALVALYEHSVFVWARDGDQLLRPVGVGSGRTGAADPPELEAAEERLHDSSTR